MIDLPTQASVTPQGVLRLTSTQGTSADLHPLWLRERNRDPAHYDSGSNQRLFEPCLLPADLTVRAASVDSTGGLMVVFSDDCTVSFDGPALARELGWASDPLAPPAPTPWTARDVDRTTASWPTLNDPDAMRDLLDGFLRTGFCILSDVPRVSGTLLDVAGRFGFVRDTNWGPYFDVQTKPDPSDLAYTGLALSAHSDNPYRQPVPQIQILHCLETTVVGGLSTLVDGASVVARLGEEMPEETKVLEQLPVCFRYDSHHAVLQDRAPVIDRHVDGSLKCLRFSPRLDFVPAYNPATLALFYRGRRRLFELAADPEFEIRLKLAPGMLLMMDNLRLLHGRTAFESSQGHRHLQGCYIDLDGPDSLYRMLARGDSILGVGRDVA